MNKLSDIHSHIIPRVDDGSSSMDMSLSMIEEACRQGTDIIFATPHSSAFDDYGSLLIQTKFETLRYEAAERKLPAQLYLGCEILTDTWNIETTIEKIRNDIYPTMNGTKHVLIEFDPWEEEENIIYCLKRILEEGYLPIIAHSERCNHLTLDTVERLKKEGILIQINVYSLEKEKDPEIKTKARNLVERKIVDFLGTDMHRTDHRPPVIEEGMKYLSYQQNQKYIEDIAWKNVDRFLISQDASR